MRQALKVRGRLGREMDANNRQIATQAVLNRQLAHSPPSWSEDAPPSAQKAEHDVHAPTPRFKPKGERCLSPALIPTRSRRTYLLPP